MRRPSEYPEPVPLGAQEWPISLRVSIMVALALAVGVCVGGLVVEDRHRGASIPGAIFLTVVLLVLAGAMFRRRYWAVVGFEMLIGFQILAASIALLLASSVRAAGLCILAIGLGGWLFWNVMRLLARMRAAMEQELAAGERR